MGATKGKFPHLPEGLRLALSDTSARRRILEVNQRDKRSLSAIDQRFRDLDRLVDFLVKHLDDPVPVDTPAAPMRKRHDTDMDIALEPLTLLDDEAPIHEDTQPEDSAQPVSESTQEGPSIEPPVTIPEPPLPAMHSRKESLAATSLISVPRKWQKPPGFKARDKVQSLLNDVMWLLEIKDGEGMLISLERLLVSHRLEGELAVFVSDNETKLMNVYESYLGPFTKTVKGLEGDLSHPMPEAFLSTAKVACVTELIREGLTIESLLKTSPYSELETCCVISQLRRVGLATVS